MDNDSLNALPCKAHPPSPRVGGEREKPESSPREGEGPLPQSSLVGSDSPATPSSLFSLEGEKGGGIKQARKRKGRRKERVV